MTTSLCSVQRLRGNWPFLNAVMTKNTISQAMVIANSTIKVLQHDKFVIARDCLDGAVQQAVEQSLDVVSRCGGRRIHKDQRKEFVLSEWDPNSHQAFVGSCWCRSMSCVLMGKPTPWMRGSLGFFPFQKMVYLELASLMLPSPGNLFSLKAATLILKWANSL